VRSRAYNSFGWPDRAADHEADIEQATNRTDMRTPDADGQSHYVAFVLSVRTVVGRGMRTLRTDMPMPASVRTPQGASHAGSVGGVWQRGAGFPVTAMARAPSTFRQQDVTRAVKAVTAAGVHIARVEIDKAGKIVIITADTTVQPGEVGEANEWDRV
jgi:hypothetical protein